MYHLKRSLRSGFGSPVCSTSSAIPLSIWGSCMLLRAAQSVQDLRYHPVEHEIRHHEEQPEREHREQDDGGGCLHILARGGDDLARFRAHVAQETGELLPGADYVPGNVLDGTGLLPLDLRRTLFAIHCDCLCHTSNPLFPASCRKSLLAFSQFRGRLGLPNWWNPVGRLLRETADAKLAGAEGFEPPSSVLETDSLTVELTPLRQRTVISGQCSVRGSLVQAFASPATSATDH